QRRDLRAGHGHPRDLRAARSRRGDARVLPRPRAHEGAARAHARQELPPGGGARVGILDATGRPRARARAAHTAVQALPGAPPGERRRVSDSAPLVEELVPAPLEPFAAEPVAGIPPFQGGAAGYVGYDWGAQLERVPRTRYDDVAIPDVMLGLYDWVIAWDHETERAWVISTGIPEQGTARRERAARRLSWVKARLGGKRETGNGKRGPLDRDVSRFSFPVSRAMSAPSYPVPDFPGLRSNFTRPGYLDVVARGIEYVYAGDIFQANLSQRLQASLAGTPFELYRRLRQRNPAPFAAYLDFGDVVVASSSPERFLRVDGGRRVETRPIKG